MGHAATVGASGILNAGGVGGIALGSSAKTTANYGTSMGANATASGTNAVAIGGVAKAASTDSATTASGADSLAIGSVSQAYGKGSVSLGAHAVTGTSSTETSANMYATAIGYTAEATSLGSVAIGAYADAKTGTYATALGYYANATGNNAIAIGGNETEGNGATASGVNAIAVGNVSKAYGKGSLAMGANAVSGTALTATGTDMYATALGTDAEATGKYATSFSATAKAYTDESLALGHAATVGASGTTDSGGVGGIAIGTAANTSKDYGISFGANATASGENAIAIGGAKKMTDTSGGVTATGATASGNSSIAIGDTAEALTNDAIAIGYKADAKTKEYATAIGIKSVATGSYATGFAAQAYAYTNQSLALGYKTTVGVSGATDSGGVSGIAIGHDADTTKDDGISLGSRAKAEGANAIAIGGNSKTGAGNAAYASGADSIAIGNKSQATKDNAVALGAEAIAKETSAIALGYSASATAADAISIGHSSVAVANAIVIGKSASTTAENGVALGDSASATKASSVAIGVGSVVSEDDSVSVGASTSSTRTITNVTAGDSTKDLANWDQLIDNNSENPYVFGADGSVTVLTNAGTTAFTLKLGSNTGAIAYENTGFVLGGTIYSYLSPTANGSYIQTGATSNVGANLTALDTAMGAVDKNYTFIKKSIDDDVTKNVSMAQNLIALDEGITRLIHHDATNQKIVIAGDSTLDASTTLSLATSTGGNRTVTGVASGTKTGEAANWDQLIPNQTYTFGTDGSVTVQTNAGAQAFKLNLTTTTAGSITPSSTGYISGGNLDTELRPTETKNYISDQSVAANLSALDQKLGVASGVEHLDGTVLYNATDDIESQIQAVGKKVIKEVTDANSSGFSDTQKIKLTTYDGTEYSIEIAGKGKVEKDDKRLVDGATVYQAIQDVKTNVTQNVESITTKLTAEKGDYIAAGDEAGKNLAALDTVIGVVENDGKVITASLKDGVLQTSVSQNLEKLDTAMGFVKKDGNAIGASFNEDGSVKTTISQNLERLDSAMQDPGMDLTHIRRVTQEQYATVAETATNGIALGHGSVTSGVNAISFGTNAAASSENAIAVGQEAKASATNSVAIGSGSEATEENTVSVGKAGSERRITNVAAGVNDTDIVNVAQFNAALKNDASGMRAGLYDDLNQVAAGSAAIAALRAESYDPYAKWSFAVGYGHYKDANAGALGVFYKPNEDTTISFGGTLGYDESLMNAGISIKLGSRGKGIGSYRMNTPLGKELSALRQYHDRLAADNRMLQEANRVQAKRIALLEASHASAKTNQVKEISALQTYKTKMKTDNAEEIKALQADNDKIRLDNETAQAANAARAVTIKAQMEEIEALKADNAKIRMDKEKLDADNVVQEKEMAALREDNEILKQQIAEILSAIELAGK